MIYLKGGFVLKILDIYTDGACSGNPGPGGYGVVLLYKGNRKELSCPLGEMCLLWA